MSHENPIPRIARVVPIPREVVSSLGEVDAAIKRGDEDTTFPSDDCIQTGCLCGGLLDDGSGRFYFSVHLEENRPYRWDIVLSPAEIEAVAQGEQETLELWCCSDPECGFKSYLENITCHWCDYGGSREWPPRPDEPFPPEVVAQAEAFMKSLEPLHQRMTEYIQQAMTRRMSKPEPEQEQEK